MSEISGPPRVGERAKEAIHSGGHSQRSVAAQMGLDETKLSKSLSGQRRFNAEELLALATATGVTVKWLLGEQSHVSATPPRPAAAAAPPASGEVAMRRRMVVEAAWTLFASRGFDAVRIADIAEEAGVSSASVHYYFAGKQELFSAALSYSVKLAFDRQIAWLSDIADPRDRLTRLLELQSPIGRTARLEWSIWLQTWSRLALEEPGNEDYVSSYRRWSATVRSTIAEGQEQGRFRPGDADAMTDELTSLLDGLGIKLMTGILDAKTLRRRISDYLDRAVLNRAG
ncbi:TetR family transcriptional regulator C-terminal domain-containing protein [Zhihengliuella salsuginis]|nr:TetR family transcriptional regulator C-terminal domain-containing protein [Zhihengliuella salsuginis]